MNSNETEDLIGRSKAYWRRVALARGDLIQDAIEQIDQQAELIDALQARIAALEKTLGLPIQRSSTERQMLAELTAEREIEQER